MSKPTIAVIGGTGAEGSGLAIRWAAEGYPVILGSRSAEKAVTTAAELSTLLPAGSATIGGLANGDAALAAEIVVLSVPYAAQHDTAAQIVAGSQGKPVISVVVPLKPPKVSVVWRPEAGSAAEELQAQLGPEAKVVAAFQNISAGHLKDLSVAGRLRRALYGRRQGCQGDRPGLDPRGGFRWRRLRSAGQLVGRGRADRNPDRRQHPQQGAGQRDSHHGHPARVTEAFGKAHP